MTWSENDRRWMERALELAARGRGLVEPNPMVGCVIVHNNEVVGEGWHQRFGGPHAEIEAMRVAGSKTRGSTMYVSLEPCCHHGKTPPCADAVIAAEIGRVIVAEQDPFPLVDGGGVMRLREAGIEVAVGLCADQAARLNAPFRKLIRKGRPWILAKWAMSLDGKIATHNGQSQWISNEESRAVVHQLRGRVDAILVGRGTVTADDPLLTARPAGVRTPTRIVLDSAGSLATDSRLVQSVSEAPVLVITGEEASNDSRSRLTDAGCEVWAAPGAAWPQRLPEVLNELGRRKMTNVLVEGGATTLGGFFDSKLVDELHTFISPRIIGGRFAPGPIGGTGVSKVAEAFALGDWQLQNLSGDLYIHGRMAY